MCVNLCMRMFFRYLLRNWSYRLLACSYVDCVKYSGLRVIYCRLEVMSCGHINIGGNELCLVGMVICLAESLSCLVDDVMPC